MTKGELRREVRRRFLATTADDRCRWSEALCQALWQDAKIERGRCIMAFYPMWDEVDIRPFLDEALRREKVVLLPEVADEESMFLREYVAGDMTRGLFGTMNSTGRVMEDYERIDVVLVPGVAFTRDGRRLGRGKGFYDRFLLRVKGAYKRGVCFPFQVVDDMVCEERDVRMDYV